MVAATASSAGIPLAISPIAPSSRAGSSSISACASRMPDSAVRPLARSRAVLTARSFRTCSTTRCSRSTPAAPVRAPGEASNRAAFQRHTGATTRPGAAAMPWSAARGGLLAEVTIDELGQGGDGLLRMWPVGADRDRRALAHAEGQHTKDALRVSHRASFDHLDLGVLEPRGGLYEERRRPRMQADFVRDGQWTFGYRLPRLLTAVVCDPERIWSRSRL